MTVPLAVVLILQIFNICFGQSADVTISLQLADRPAAEIVGRSTRNGSRNFSLPRSYGTISDLAKRVSDIRLEDKEGKPVAYKEFVPGEYVAQSDFTAWRYRVDLLPNKTAAASAHVSWVSDELGLIFLDDLLPLAVAAPGSFVDVRLNVPAGWRSFGKGGQVEAGKGVFFLARQPRVLNGTVGDIEIHVVTAGNWKFPDETALAFAKEIFGTYRDVFGGSPAGPVDIYLLPFPQKVSAGTWEADTRGKSVVILSTDMPFATQSAQRLHEQLRHEIFHLWLPNDVALKGSYDWFYEGFALYESLKVGVKLNRLRFDDYLDALGRAMTIDSMITDKRSLVDASRARIGGADTLVYARGMLAAYLADAEILQRSRGDNDVAGMMKNIYQKYRSPAAPEDGTAAVLRSIDLPEVSRFVTSGERLDWSEVSKPLGIDVAVQNGIITLKPTARPSSRQKKYLDKLGYNNWRKHPVGSK